MDKELGIGLGITLVVLVVALVGGRLYHNLTTTEYIECPVEPGIVVEEPIDTNSGEVDTHTFIGTVLEETTTYMIVEPHKDSPERKSSDKIHISYGEDHRDYLYGVGRKVIIEYSGAIMETYPAQIKTNKIDIDGYDDFELIVTPTTSINEEFEVVLNNRDLLANGSDYDLIYMGIEAVNVKVAGKEMPLKEALEEGYLTLDGIIAKANQDFPDAVSYDDGGTMDYPYENYTIRKYHTLDGNRNVCIMRK